MNYLGYHIQVQPPMKTYTYSVRTTKSKVGTRKVRVKKFSHLVEVLKDGEVLFYRALNTYVMNAATKDRLERELALDSKLSGNYNPYQPIKQNYHRGETL